MAQVLTAVTAWCQHNDAADAFPELFGAVRLQHLQLHELHVLLQHGMLGAFPDALAAVHAALANNSEQAEDAAAGGKVSAGKRPPGTPSSDRRR